MNEPSDSDPDTKELGEYFLEKSADVIDESITRLATLIDRAAKLSNALDSNDELAWRCAVDRCLARGDDATKRCRSCEAAATARRLVEQLEVLRTERSLAARIASSMRDESEARFARMERQSRGIKPS